MKPQVMPVTAPATVREELQQNGDIFSKTDKEFVKQEPADENSDSELIGTRDAPGPRHSHHRKKMMEKWVNGNERRRLSPRRHGNRDENTPSKSPSPPPPTLTQIPADPRKWSSQHVTTWLEVLATRHGLTVDTSDFQMNGRALCLMRKDGFISRVPENGAVLYEDFRGRVRRYLSACRRRFRLTTMNPASMATGMPPYLAPRGPTAGAPHFQMASMMSPGLHPHLMRPFTPLHNRLPNVQHDSRVVPPGQSAPTIVPSAQTRLGVPCFMHAASSAQSPTLLLQPAPSFLGQQPRPSISNIGPLLGGSLHTNTSAASSLSAIPSPLRLAHRSHPLVSSAQSTENATSLHTTQHSSVIVTHPSLHTTPSASQAHATPTHTVSSTCPVHGATSAARAHPHDPTTRPPLVHTTPFYKFVPQYRTMKVYGHFQPIPYTYHFNDTPNHQNPPVTAQHPPASPTESQSRVRQMASPSPNTPRPSDQSHALDLSTSSKSVRAVPSSGLDVPRPEPELEYKKFKTEPMSP